MAQPRPRPVALDPEWSQARPPASTPRGRQPGLVAATLAVLLALALGVALQQARRAGVLLAELEAARTELGSAKAEVRAYRGQLVDVRAAVDELQGILDRDPLAPR